MTTKYWAIIAAAGKGHRMGATMPKQYLSLQGKPIISHTLNRLSGIPQFERIVVAIHPDDLYWSDLNFQQAKLMIAHGSDERHRSVLNSLNALKDYAKPNDWILVHDAVRPFIKASDIEKLMFAVRDHPVGGLLGVRITDTVKKVTTENNVATTLDRRELWSAQSPQLFRYELLYNALQNAVTNNIPVTDEASAIELAGFIPLMVEGSKSNIKITQPEDMLLAEAYVQLSFVTPISSVATEEL